MELKFDPGLRVIGEYLSQIDSQYRVNFKIASQYRVNLTQIFSSYSESCVEFSSTSDSTF